MKGSPILKANSKLFGVLLIVSSSLGYSEDLDIAIDYPEPGASIVELARIGNAAHPKDLAMSRDTVFLSSDGAQVTCIKKVEGSHVVILRMYENTLRQKIADEFVWPLDEKEARPFLGLWLGWLRNPVYQRGEFEPGVNWQFAAMNGFEVFEGRITRSSDDQERFSDLMSSLVSSIHIVAMLNDLASGDPEALKKRPGSPSRQEVKEDYQESRQELHLEINRLRAVLNPDLKK